MTKGLGWSWGWYGETRDFGHYHYLHKTHVEVLGGNNGCQDCASRLVRDGRVVQSLFPLLCYRSLYETFNVFPDVLVPGKLNDDPPFLKPTYTSPDTSFIEDTTRFVPQFSKCICLYKSDVYRDFPSVILERKCPPLWFRVSVFYRTDASVSESPTQTQPRVRRTEV